MMQRKRTAGQFAVETVRHLLWTMGVGTTIVIVMALLHTGHHYPSPDEQPLYPATVAPDTVPTALFTIVSTDVLVVGGTTAPICQTDPWNRPECGPGYSTTIAALVPDSAHVLHVLHMQHVRHIGTWLRVRDGWDPVPVAIRNQFRLDGTPLGRHARIKYGDTTYIDPDGHPGGMVYTS